MNLQNEAWIVTLAGTGLVALGFLYVIAQAGSPAEASTFKHRSYALRAWLFGALVVLGIGVTWATLGQFPIPDQAAQGGGNQVVHVVARQWSWEISPNEVRAGSPVEFLVTSADVNHGFAIYGPDDRIVIQTQAMPGFTNRLLYTFATPGSYRVLCLEYCGLAHHGMFGEVKVLAAAGGRS
jgi:cytochrome c oxidase subunit 2